MTFKIGDIVRIKEKNLIGEIVEIYGNYTDRYVVDFKQSDLGFYRNHVGLMWLNPGPGAVIGMEEIEKVSEEEAKTWEILNS
jgi:hypothetical protein